MKRRTGGVERTNDYIYLTVLTVIAFLALGTFFHDPLLHGLIAFLYGWPISSYETGLMVGSTVIALPKGASLFSVWIFYMFPALFIFAAVIIATILRPYRLVMVAGIILMSLNLPSLNPGIGGSDASGAARILVSQGWPEPAANLLHYILFFKILALWGLYLYVAVESSPKDSRGRMINIVR